MPTPGPAVVGQPTVSLQGQGELSAGEDNIWCPCLVCAYKCLGLLPGLMTKPGSQSPLSGLTVSLNSSKRERCGRGKCLTKRKDWHIRYGCLLGREEMDMDCPGLT